MPTVGTAHARANENIGKKGKQSQGFLKSMKRLRTFEKV